jgi:hypothetical protein
MQGTNADMRASEVTGMCRLSLLLMLVGLQVALLWRLSIQTAAAFVMLMVDLCFVVMRTQRDACWHVVETRACWNGRLA